MHHKDLINCKKNIHSQNGEDGVIEEICKRIPMDDGFFVEFGAWDGKHLSNTYNLLSKRWKGVYIEGDPQKYKDLLETKKKFPSQIEAICAYVDYKGENTLDNILSKTSTPLDFDLLSIDIDSYDWQVWYSLQKYKPKLVIIEGNSEILPGVWQIHQEGICQGSSFSALHSLGKDKGYTLVCHTGNLFFLRKELLDTINLSPIHIKYPETLFNYQLHCNEVRNQKKIQRKNNSFRKRIKKMMGEILSIKKVV